jgi:hypothetical protein
MAPGDRCGSGSTTLHVSQTFDDLAVPNAHDVDASHPVRLALAPAQLPADDPAVLAGPDLLRFEDKVRRGRDAPPEIEAGFTSFVARAIRSGARVLENAPLADQGV